MMDCDPDLQGHFGTKEEADAFAADIEKLAGVGELAEASPDRRA